MKIAYVGDFINHGKSLHTTGTPLVILLSLLNNVDSIDVYCPKVNEEIEYFELPRKVRLMEFYEYDDPLSIIKLLEINWLNYDLVIFNLLPTGFGRRSLANASALIIPLLLVKVFRMINIQIIYHNSVFTNDVRRLGYDSAFDKFRLFLLRIVERTLFKNVSTYVLLKLYKHRIKESIGKNQVHLLPIRYLEAITTLYINNVLNMENLKIEKTDPSTILMHGSWGPQKNIELGLSSLRNLKKQGIKFKLIISGGINHHFSKYEEKFHELLASYSDVVNQYLGPIDERRILGIFLETSLLILPYNTPGGHSGVLEQAIFFETPTVVLDFPEYREQAKGVASVRVTSKRDFEKSIYEMLKVSAKTSNLIINRKIDEVMHETEKYIFLKIKRSHDKE